MPKKAKDTKSVLYVELDPETTKKFLAIKAKSNVWERSTKGIIQRLIAEEFQRME